MDFTTLMRKPINLLPKQMKFTLHNKSISEKVTLLYTCSTGFIDLSKSLDQFGYFFNVVTFNSTRNEAKPTLNRCRGRACFGRLQPPLCRGPCGKHFVWAFVTDIKLCCRNYPVSVNMPSVSKKYLLRLWQIVSGHWTQIGLYCTFVYLNLCLRLIITKVFF